MDFDYCLQQLTVNVEVIARLFESVPEAQARWKPDPASWSMLEVINHLADEEQQDFGLRLRHLWANNPDPWPGINPPQWVIDRAYNQRDPAESLARFRQARAESLAWLPQAREMDWEKAYLHPPLDGLKAGHLLAAWAAHDLLHLRQLNELLYAYGQTRTAPYSPMYAGEW